MIIGSCWNLKCEICGSNNVHPYCSGGSKYSIVLSHKYDGTVAAEGVWKIPACTLVHCSSPRIRETVASRQTSHRCSSVPGRCWIMWRLFNVIDTELRVRPLFCLSLSASLLLWYHWGFSAASFEIEKKCLESIEQF